MACQSSMYEELCSWENLLLAWQKASRGKRGKFAAAAFEHRLEDQLVELRDELRSRTYQPGLYRSFYVHDPKRRLISAAPFRDRVVHHALCNVIEPVFERSFIADSYANRMGKGTHRALDRVQQLSRRFSYVLQCDIRQFFPSIDHHILLEVLARKVDDTLVRALIRLIVDSGRGVLAAEYSMVYFGDDDLFAIGRPRGLPIGNLTSQFWANCYLNPFDHFVKRELRCHGYLRYVDDFLLFSNSKRTLWQWKRAIEKRLAVLRLTIHPGARPQPVGEGVPFLGFVVYRYLRRLKRRKGIQFQRKLRGLVEGVELGELALEQLQASVRGWVNHLRYANTVGLRKAVLGRVRFTPAPPRKQVRA